MEARATDLQTQFRNILIYTELHMFHKIIGTVLKYRIYIKDCMRLTVIEKIYYCYYQI